MFERILPRTFDNRFQGHMLALWLFAPLVAMKIIMSLVHIFFKDGGAQSLATIPLDSLMAEDANTIVALFAHMGVAQLLLGVLCLVVLLKYRSMIPLMYSLMLLNYFAEDWIAALKPMSMIGVSGSSVFAQILLMMTIFGFVLSLYRPPQGSKKKSLNRSQSLPL